MVRYLKTVSRQTLHKRIDQKKHNSKETNNRESKVKMKRYTTSVLRMYNSRPSCIVFEVTLNIYLSIRSWYFPIKY